MATPPTFVAEYESAWNTSTSPKSVSVTTAVGDVLVCIAATEDAPKTLGTPTGGTGLTWTLQQSYTPASGNSPIYLWTAVATTAETFTCTITKTGSGTVQWWGFNVLRFSGSDGIGASNKAQNASGAPSVTLTTTTDNAAIVCVNVDYSGASGASRTWRTINGSVGTEATYFSDSAHYTIYGNRWGDAGVAGADTVGLSAPTGQNYSILAVEVKGAAGGAAPTAPPMLHPAVRLLPILAR